MTKLIVHRLDGSKPGSYKQRREWRRMLLEIQDAQASTDPRAPLLAWDRAEDWLISRLETDDGTPVEDVLGQLSSDEFDALFQAIGSEENVPPESASS